MSGEHTHSYDSQGSSLDSQPASPLKRIRSSEQEGSAKRQQQDPNLPAESLFEVAKKMFRQASEQQLHTKLYSLMRAKASPQELEAAYSPFFKELARAIAGRDDIPVPPARPFVGSFVAGDPALEELLANPRIEEVVKY
ncbi:hypothetical protein C0992_010497, partial [Termitomyces sp. T32_za158]